MSESSRDGVQSWTKSMNTVTVFGRSPSHFGNLAQLTGSATRPTPPGARPTRSFRISSTKARCVASKPVRRRATSRTTRDCSSRKFGRSSRRTRARSCATNWPHSSRRSRSGRRLTTSRRGKSSNSRLLMRTSQCQAPRPPRCHSVLARERGGSPPHQTCVGALLGCRSRPRTGDRRGRPRHELILLSHSMIFLAGRDRYTQRTLLSDVHDRLTNQPGCEEFRYRRSRRRPRYVIVDVDPTTFLSDSSDAVTARLEIRFWCPAGVDHEYYRINWIEPDRNLMLSFHQDADHPDLGPCHIQLNHEDTPVDRHSATFLDAHPLAVLYERLAQLPAVIEAINWENATSSFPP